MQKNDTYWMGKALECAQKAYELNEVPVGAIVVVGDEMVAQGWNQPITGCDPTAHAEIIALRCAAKVMQNYRMVGATLYVTIEPCTMCLGAMIHGRINRLVYGAIEPKAGVIESVEDVHTKTYFNHSLEVEGGVLAQECSSIISDFFRMRRSVQKAEKRDKPAT